MMLENFPWPQTILGMAAALAILVIYDVVYVWPIHRRISTLTDRCAVLERTLGGVLDGLAARVANVDQRTREDLNRVVERVGQLELATDSRSYEQAITSAEHGEETARLIACFGLTEGEADLVKLLHGDRSRRMALKKSA
jgi:uncharacterized coiled-coil protein SlyX